MSAHTPTPWRIVKDDAGHSVRIVNERGFLVANVFGATGPKAELTANAAFIVRACNSHARLVAALGHILSMAEDAHTDTDTDTDTDTQRGLKMHGIETLARAALTAAKSP